MSTLKDEILSNQFTTLVRMKCVIDRDEYDKLCAALKRLAVEWRGKALVDKQLAQELYSLAPIVRNAGLALQEHAGTMAAELEAFAVELDALVLECLAD